MKTRRIIAVDLFCGGGGTSTGMLLACSALGIDPAQIDLTAVNHLPIAIATHAANHPRARNICSRIEQLQPERIVPGRPDLLWASPECIHHSIARGGRPRSDQSRSQAWTVLDWIQRLSPKAVLIENVPEFAQWGPLVADGANSGQVIRSRVGDTFRAWVSGMESLGYQTGWRVLNCADYGDATTRKRFFLMARRGNRRATWPEPTHAEGGCAGLFGAAKPWVPARDIIDWSIPGHSIFLSREDARSAKLNISRPLAANTLRRIEAGIRRYWGELAEPFLSVLNNWPSQAAGQSLDKPLPTQTTANHFGVIRPFFVLLNGTKSGQIDGSCIHGDTPLPTITTSGHLGLVQPFILGQQSGSAPRAVQSPLMTVCTEARGMALLQPFIMSIVHSGGARSRPISDPLPTMTTKAEQCVVRPFIVKYYGTGAAVDLESPLDSVTTDDRFGLVRPMIAEFGGERYLMDILFRMLTPMELAAAHSFPADYQWRGNKSEIVKQIGNSVPVRTAQALCHSALAS